MTVVSYEEPTIIVDADKVEINNDRYPETEPLKFLETVLGGPVESCSDYTGKVLDMSNFANSLVAGANVAYDRHYPFYLSPDIMWLTLTQGLAIHINENAESLRKHFVNHEGKALIHIERDNFVRCSPENPWEEVFPEFSMKIKQYIGEKTHSLIVADFSTTDIKARAASEITLMDAMQSYFEYGMSTCCGIPKFEISGTLEDWQSMRDKVGEWAKWDLEWWTESVQHVLDNIILAFEGDADQEWFQYFFKETGGSGGPFIDGWINWLFPYFKRRKGYSRNSYVGKLGGFCGAKTGDFPASVAKAPFWWNYFGNRYDYQFVGGIMGIEQRDDMTLCPRVGWAVMEDPTVDKKEQGRPFDKSEIAPEIEPPSK